LADLELKPGFRRFAGKSGIAEGRSDLRECRESTVMSDSALKLQLRLLLKFRRYSGSGGVLFSKPVLRCGVKRVLLKSWCGGTA